MANGNCPNTPYFVAKDGVYDGEIGAGTQCIGTNSGTYTLNSQDYLDSNSIRIKIARGNINLKTLSLQISPAWNMMCKTSANWQILSNGFYAGTIGNSSHDQSCERSRVVETGKASGILPGGSKQNAFQGVVGSLQV